MSNIKIKFCIFLTSLVSYVNGLSYCVHLANFKCQVTLTGTGDGVDAGPPCGWPASLSVHFVTPAEPSYSSFLWNPSLSTLRHELLTCPLPALTRKTFISENEQAQLRLPPFLTSHLYFWNDTQVFLLCPGLPSLIKPLDPLSPCKVEHSTSLLSTKYSTASRLGNT